MIDILRNDPLSECCDAPLHNYENDLGLCSDCNDWAAAWNLDDFNGAEKIMNDLVLDCKKLLSPQQYKMLYMYAIKGMTFGNIADHLNLSESGARYSVWSAIRKCKRKFQNKGYYYGRNW
jgi:DNA-directed RNA polymerase specialized sigma24 family protein